MPVLENVLTWGQWIHDYTIKLRESEYISDILQNEQIFGIATIFYEDKSHADIKDMISRVLQQYGKIPFDINELHKYEFLIKLNILELSETEDFIKAMNVYKNLGAILTPILFYLCIENLELNILELSDELLIDALSYYLYDRFN